MYLSREQILDSVDRTFVDVPVPEWGGTARVGSFSALARTAFEQKVYRDERKEVDMSEYKLRLVVACLVDEDGNAVFSDEDVALLGSKSAAALDRVFIEASRVNGLLPSNEKAIEGNSEAGPDGSSNSDSHTG